jgi:hypothetical protein
MHEKDYKKKYAKMRIFDEVVELVVEQRRRGQSRRGNQLPVLETMIGYVAE